MKLITSSQHQNFKVIFPKIGDAKIKEGIFVGLQIRQFLDNEIIYELELSA